MKKRQDDYPQDCRQVMSDQVIIAAHNATVEEKATADYWCDGVNDPEVLRAARETGRDMKLTSGDFYFQKMESNYELNKTAILRALCLGVMVDEVPEMDSVDTDRIAGWLASEGIGPQGL